MKRIDQLNQTDIEYHLRSAVDSLVPDVFDKINLDAPQEAAERIGSKVQGREN